MVGMTRPGAFAERMSIPGRCLIELPDSLSDVQAALTEPAATALHAVNLSLKSRWHGRCPSAACWCWAAARSACSPRCCCATRAWPRCAWPRSTRCAAQAIERHARCDSYDPRQEGPGESAFDYVIDAVGSAPTRRPPSPPSSPAAW
jgi:hypothetical protein